MEALLAGVLRNFGVQPVRGSSKQARRPGVARGEPRWAGRGEAIWLVTPDGPRGPCYVVQEGVIALAQVTGLPIVPVFLPVGLENPGKEWGPGLNFLFPSPIAK